MDKSCSGDITSHILERLRMLSDDGYHRFMIPLIPGISPDRMLGVRVPHIRKLAASLCSTEADAFISQLPHRYLEENYLHAFIISAIKDEEALILKVDRFLPFIDNWAICDSLRPRLFPKMGQRLLPHVERWMSDDHPYIKRFGIECLMCYFLDDLFSEEYLAAVARVHCNHYYVEMMQAWYFATALAKQWSCTVEYIKQGILPPGVHNKTIRKAIESRRISDSKKEYLRTLALK